MKIKLCECGHLGHIHSTLFSLKNTNGLSELVRNNTRPEKLARDKHSSLFGTLKNHKENEVL